MECSICYEPMGETNIAITECNHKFHLTCFKKWSKETCPMCRSCPKELLLPEIYNYLSGNDDEDVDKKTLLFYISNYLQNNMLDIQPIYRGLTTRFIKLYTDMVYDEEHAVSYILRNKLYNLLPYYNLDTLDNQYALIDENNVQLTKYIHFNEYTTLYNIVKFGSYNLLRYYRDEIDNRYYTDYRRVTNKLHSINLLGFACALSQFDIVKYLSKYLDINEPNDWNCTPLFMAIYSGSFKIVQWLVEQGVDIHIKHACGSSPLFFAIENKQFKIAHYLINQGAIIDSSIIRACLQFTTDKDGGSKMLQRVLALISKDDFYPMNIPFCCNSTSSHALIDYCFCKNCTYETDACSGKGWSYLQAACFRVKFHSILLLLSYDINVVHHQPETCIHLQKHLLNKEYSVNNSSTDLDLNTFEEYLFYNLHIPRNHGCYCDWKCVYGENCQYKDIPKLKKIATYITSLIKRGDKISWKHQRKILNKMLKDVNMSFTNAVN